MGEPSGIARVVADADVLAADLLVGGPAREALDVLRSHSWMALVASDALLDDAEAVIAGLADDDLAADWRTAVTAIADVVEVGRAGDHPGLAAARAGDARHLLSLDERLRSAGTGLAVRRLVETSIKHPGAFVSTFDPATAHELVVGGDYPGPDRDPRG